MAILTMPALPDFALFLATSAVTLTIFVTITRRLLLSPLKSIPGPKWASVSAIWLWVHDLQGTAPGVIKDLHRQYGSIVRVGPNEISIDDIEVHNSVLFCQGPKFMKASYYYDAFKTGPPGTFQSTDQAEHAMLRRLVSRPFSRTNVLDFEPEIYASINELLSVVAERSAAKSVVDLSKMFRCLALDFITNFTYGESMHTVQTPDFDESILEAFDQFAVSNFLFMMLPSLRSASIALLSLIPMRVFQAIPTMRKRVEQGLQIQETRAQDKPNDSPKFTPLLVAEIKAAQAQEYPISRGFLVADGLGDIFAGTDTTSTTLTMTIREIFKDPAIYTRLHEELKTVLPSIMTIPALVELEKLPFLSACVKEGLRYSTPVRSRLPRVCPPSGWTYKGHNIPSGTIVSSSPHLMNYNDTVFPSPKVFTPDRWMSDDVEAVRLMNATTAPFSKGSRGCIGKNLALAELYLTIAITIRRFKVAQIIDEDLKIREIFGVIFDKPVRMRLEVVTV